MNPRFTTVECAIECRLSYAIEANKSKQRQQWAQNRMKTNDVRFFIVAAAVVAVVETTS